VDGILAHLVSVLGQNPSDQPGGVLLRVGQHEVQVALAVLVQRFPDPPDDAEAHWPNLKRLPEVCELCAIRPRFLQAEFAPAEE